MFAPKARTVPALLALCASVLLGPGHAWAGAELLSADPAPDSAVASPMLIQLHFSEAIDKRSSSVELTDAGGNAVATMPMGAKDAKSVALMPNQQLGAGKYTVSWAAVSSDGRKITGSFSFTVK
jgi:hypothetical protein